MILIVDDNPRVANALVRLLKSAGFEALACENGADALIAINDHVISAAVVDIHLPDISGLDLTARLRDRFGSRIPIVIVSGDTSMETLNSLPHVGATYFFGKPLSADYLLQCLREWLEVGERV